MTAFAPTVPSPNVAATSDPEYTSYRWSRPIAPFEGNKSTAIAIEGGAKALEEGTNAADTLIKNHIAQGIEKEAAPVRDAFSNQLEGTLAGIRGQTASTPAAMSYAETPTDSKAKLDILTDPGKEKNLPKDVQGIGPILDSLVNRKANGSISETQYRGQIDTLAKKWRNTWPGYTSEIDAQFDRVTERGVANDYIKSMVGDLNNYATAAKEAHSKYESMAFEGAKNIAGFDQTLARWKDGKISDGEMAHLYNQGMSYKFEAEKARSAVEVAEAGTKLAGIAAERYVKATVDAPIKQSLVQMGSVLGKNLDQIHTEITNGTLDPAHSEQLATGLTVMRDQALANARKEFSNVNPKTGRTIAQDMPDGQLEKLINDNQYVKNMTATIDMLNSKEHGYATLALRMQTADVDNDLWKLRSDKTGVGTAVKALQDTQKLGDPATRKVLEGFIPDLTQLPDWFRNNNVAMSTQAITGTEDKEVHTFHDAIDEATKNGAKDPVAFKRLFTTGMQHITDPGVSPAVKAGYLDATFNTKNLGLLDKIEDDHRDSKTGAMIPGKVWTFRQFTNDAVAAEVDKVAKVMNRPDLKDKYQEYVAKEGQQLISGQVSRLEEYFDNPYLKVSYDNEHQQFKAVDPFFKPRPMFGNNQSSPIEDAANQDSIDNINQVLSSIATMAKGTGQDPNMLTFELLSAMLPPNSPVLKAIMSSAPQPKAESK